MTASKTLGTFLSLATVLVNISCPAQGDSLAPMDPFEDMTEAVVEITIGDPIPPLDLKSERLFGIDRIEPFLIQLKAAVARRLNQSGIEVVDSATGGIVIGVWGHEIPGSSCDLKWVFYLDLALHAPDDDSLDPMARRGKVGVAADEELETILVDSVLLMLDEYLYRRDLSRPELGLPANNRIRGDRNPRKFARLPFKANQLSIPTTESSPPGTSHDWQSIDAPGLFWRMVPLP